jgi:hypothetical protein
MEKVVKLNLTALELVQTVLGFILGTYAILVFGLRQEDRESGEWKAWSNRVFQAVLVLLTASHAFKGSKGGRRGSTGRARGSMQRRSSGIRTSGGKGRPSTPALRTTGTIDEEGAGWDDEEEEEEVAIEMVARRTSIWEGGSKHAEKRASQDRMPGVPGGNFNFKRSSVDSDGGTTVSGRRQSLNCSEGEGAGAGGGGRRRSSTGFRGPRGERGGTTASESTNKSEGGDGGGTLFNPGYL